MYDVEQGHYVFHITWKGVDTNTCSRTGVAEQSNINVCHDNVQFHNRAHKMPIVLVQILNHKLKYFSIVISTGIAVMNL